MTRLALIAGAGGELASALAQEFSAAGYEVVGLRRTAAPDQGSIRTVACDLQDATQTRSVVAAIQAEHDGIHVLICNAALFVRAPFLELGSGSFERAWRACMDSAIGAVSAALPIMLKQGYGTILFTGATASLRGSANFAAFAAAKFALRGMAQSLAREFQPRGIHIAHVVLDGILKDSAARFGVDPARAICARDAARAYRLLAEQPSSAWTHELDLRPSSETF